MRRTHSSIAIILLFIAAAFHVSNCDKVTIYTKENPFDFIETAFIAETKEIEIRITKADPENTAVWNFQASPFLDNSTWFPEEGGDWMKKVDISKDTKYYKVYRLNFTKVLDVQANDTNSDTPCGIIDQTNDLLCTFKHYYTLNPEEMTYPIYLKIENKMADEPTIKILGGAFNNSKGLFHTKDATFTRLALENQNSYLSVETSADYDKPMRKLNLQPDNANAKKILAEVKPAFVYFRCANFNKLALFQQEQPLDWTTPVNLAKFGLPFDSNYTCKFTLIMAELTNNASLVPIQSKTLVQVNANPNYTEWAIDFPEVTTLRYNLTQMQNELSNHTAQIAAAKMEAKMDLMKFMMEFQKKSQANNETLQKTFGEIKTNFGNVKGNFVTVKDNMGDMKTMIIILFVLVGLLLVGLLVQCFVIMRMKKDGGETVHNTVEISNSPYVKA